ncbi:hypothetical protein COCC4DRAFT_30165 [Bipolaris maydis ATCC 48331]|uniref:Uncharacterized protein n=2 Tax=Cochliobolus heterostrophus TaxID=5016 RepID=M2U9L8_COCH5|nr:uncharacterized protein COCC4DRAFT_30165 [Bipolaris maydis ATCC 48331]EMD85471.1 hypothetical protein COCHEDRAFT_1024417 [Bipolaris maydis C5]EMD90421.1 hypothetical protein COCHEDRAFT_1022341 [Bipolaris maydis C5]ENI09366.1 hypothetical protein COCC4DRAFT_30165 [Bipolaris maydis ATCC 48331]
MPFHRLVLMPSVEYFCWYLLEPISRIDTGSMWCANPTDGFQEASWATLLNLLTIFVADNGRYLVAILRRPESSAHPYQVTGHVSFSMFNQEGAIFTKSSIPKREMNLDAHIQLYSDYGYPPTSRVHLTNKTPITRAACSQASPSSPPGPLSNTLRTFYTVYSRIDVYRQGTAVLTADQFDDVHL